MKGSSSYGPLPVEFIGSVEFSVTTGQFVCARMAAAAGAFAHTAAWTRLVMQQRHPLCDQRRRSARLLGWSPGLRAFGRMGCDVGGGWVEPPTKNAQFIIIIAPTTPETTTTMMISIDRSTLQSHFGSTTPQLNASIHHNPTHRSLGRLRAGHAGSIRERPRTVGGEEASELNQSQTGLGRTRRRTSIDRRAHVLAAAAAATVGAAAAAARIRSTRSAAPEWTGLASGPEGPMAIIRATTAAPTGTRRPTRRRGRTRVC